MFLFVLACASPVSPVVPSRIPTGAAAPSPTTPSGLVLLDPLVIPDLPALTSPVGPRPFASPFGPRFSDGRDEMHRGIDWAGTRGEPVVASLAGTVRTVRRPTQSSQSLFVILEHEVDPFTWQGEVFERIYTSYHHLDSTPLEEHERVDQGALVGEMGDTGNAETVHLHFELRLGTHCSLSYQLDNPDSSCVTGFSPHVDPLMVLDTPQQPIELTTDGNRITLTAAAQDPSIRRVETPQGAFDLATWEGLDPSSDHTLEDFDLGWVTLVPVDTDAERVLHLDFPVLPAWIRVWDATGEGLQRTLHAP